MKQNPLSLDRAIALADELETALLVVASDPAVPKALRDEAMGRAWAAGHIHSVLFCNGEIPRRDLQVTITRRPGEPVPVRHARPASA